MAFKPFKKLLFGFAFSPSLKANVFEVTRLASFLDSSLVFVHIGRMFRCTYKCRTFLEGREAR
jgi:nucleotide-binding universal stress UspA family protein